MRYIYDNDLHIHSKISACSNDDGQTNERILKYAEDNNLKTVCLTDHFWDERVEGVSEWYRPQNFEHIKAAKPLPQKEGIRFLFGCETDMDKNMNLGISRERFDEFDFIVIPTTHLHMMGFTLSEEDRSEEARARLWIKRLDAVLNKELPFHKIGIAHLATYGISPVSRESYIKTLDLISSDAMGELFKKAASVKCGIEINGSDMQFADSEKESVLRMFKIAKQCGCKFYFGSDAHHPDEFNKMKDVFERAIDLLELSEADKFYINL